LIDCCADSEHLQLVTPRGALYGFPGVVGDAARGFDDHAFALQMLEQEDVLIMPGSGFNAPTRNHMRVTLLPEADVLREVFQRMDRVLSQRTERSSTRVAAVA
jgi:alanine-synthesizing transaminase